MLIDEDYLLSDHMYSRKFQVESTQVKFGKRSMQTQALLKSNVQKVCDPQELKKKSLMLMKEAFI